MSDKNSNSCKSGEAVKSEASLINDSNNHDDHYNDAGGFHNNDCADVRPDAPPDSAVLGATLNITDDGLAGILQQLTQFSNHEVRKNLNSIENKPLIEENEKNLSDFVFRMTFRSKEKYLLFKDSIIPPLKLSLQEKNINIELIESAGCFDVIGCYKNTRNEISVTAAHSLNANETNSLKKFCFKCNRKHEDNDCLLPKNQNHMNKNQKMIRLNPARQAMNMQARYGHEDKDWLLPKNQNHMTKNQEMIRFNPTRQAMNMQARYGHEDKDCLLSKIKNQNHMNKNQKMIRFNPNRQVMNMQARCGHEDKDWLLPKNQNHMTKNQEMIRFNPTRQAMNMQARYGHEDKDWLLPKNQNHMTKNQEMIRFNPTRQAMNMQARYGHEDKDCLLSKIKNQNHMNKNQKMIRFNPNRQVMNMQARCGHEDKDWLLPKNQNHMTKNQKMIRFNPNRQVMHMQARCGRISLQKRLSFTLNAALASRSGEIKPFFREMMHELGYAPGWIEGARNFFCFSSESRINDEKRTVRYTGFNLHRQTAHSNEDKEVSSSDGEKSKY